MMREPRALLDCCDNEQCPEMNRFASSTCIAAVYVLSRRGCSSKGNLSRGAAQITSECGGKDPVYLMKASRDRSSVTVTARMTISPVTMIWM